MGMNVVTTACTLLSNQMRQLRIASRFALELNGVGLIGVVSTKSCCLFTDFMVTGFMHPDQFAPVP